MSAEQTMRARRVGEGIREELSVLIGREVKDPNAAGAVVTRVEMSSDLHIARVYVRALVMVDDDSRRKALVAALRRASGMLRREVTRRLGLRSAPELRFAYDDGADHSDRIGELLDEIAAERRSH